MVELALAALAPAPIGATVALRPMRRDGVAVVEASVGDGNLQRHRQAAAQAAGRL